MKGLLLFFGCLVIFIIGVGYYLQPNDLGQCSTRPDASCQSADAIVVVSGGDTSARVSRGIELFNNGWANKLVFSGAASDKSGPSNAAAMKTQAVAAGVPAEAILIDEYSANTQENARNSQSIFEEQQFKKIILVTSGYHQRRASLEFQHESAGAVKVINAPLANDKDWGPFWWMTPRGWWLAGGELTKVIAFYIGAGR